MKQCNWICNDEDPDEGYWMCALERGHEGSHQDGFGGRQDKDWRDARTTAKVSIVPAPRPANESRESWRAVIAEALPEGEQIDFAALEFVPCWSCSTAPGAPHLCRGCLANRQTITELREQRQKQLDMLLRLQQGIRNAAHEASCVESRLIGIATAIETEI